VNADPGRVWQIINGFAGYWTVVAAVQLGLFDALAAGPRPAGALLADCPPETVARVAVLADALVALELLDADDGCYSLTATAATHLLSAAPRSMAPVRGRMPAMWNMGRGDQKRSAARMS